MRITVLGPLTVDGSDRLSPRDRVVLQALTAHLGRPVSGDRLSDALWGERAPVSAAKVVQGCVLRLRRRLGPEAIATTSAGYQLTVHDDDVDAGRFEQQVNRGRELLALAEPDRAAYLLGEALALWRGEPYADLAEWPDGRIEADRLRELHLEAEELRVDALLLAGRQQEVQVDTHALVRAAPLREHRWSQLALAQYRAGRQADALRTLQTVKRLLDEQLGIEPSAELVALEQAILRQDPSIVVADSVPSRDRCPYPGLRAYDVREAESFFGREEELALCVERLRTEGVVALVGPSGCGKSSLLRAGLAAAWRRRGLRAVVITPGDHPLTSLPGLGGARDSALLVDQAEEVFTLCDDPAERARFLDALVEIAAERPVAVSLRADRMSDAATHPGFSRFLERGLLLLGAMSEESLRRAVTAPARQAGLVLEPGLVDLLVREVRDDPGALPLLGHALVETWRRREGSTLTVAGYQATGGIQGAVAQSAEQLYRSLPSDRQLLLRDLMLRLIVASAEGEPVRSKVPRRLVVRERDREELVEMLVAARLVTSDEGMLAVTHEALARAWPRLRSWLDEDVEGRRILAHLAAAADSWESLGRPDSELYRGVRLARVLEWRDRSGAGLTGVEDEFLAASRERSAVEAAELRERARTQGLLIRRLRRVLGGAVVLLVLALVAGALAAVQSRRASTLAADAGAAEEAAITAEVSAVARGAAARAVASDDPARALLLALAAVRIEESPQTTTALSTVLARNPGLVASTDFPGPEVMTVEASPDGPLAVLDTRHHLSLVDPVTGEVRAERQVGAPRSEVEELRPLAFHPKGDVLAVAAPALSARPVLMLDGADLDPAPEQLGGWPRGRWQVVDLDWSERGGHLAVALNHIHFEPDAAFADRAAVLVWDLDRPDRPVRFSVDSTVGAVLSADGSTVYTVEPDITARQVATGRTRVLVTQEESFLGAIEMLPGVGAGTLAVARGLLGDTLLIDANSGAVRHRLRQGGNVGSLTFESPLALATVDWHSRRTVLWDPDSGRRLGEMDLGRGSSEAVVAIRSAFPPAPDDRAVRLVSGGRDEALRHWSLAGSPLLRRVPLPSLPWKLGEVGACAAGIGPGATHVSYIRCPRGLNHPARSLVLLDLVSRRAGPEVTLGSGYSFGYGSWWGGEFVWALDGVLRRFDAASAQVVHSARPGGRDVTEVDHTHDGSHLVAAELSGQVRLLDAKTLQQVGTPVDVGDEVCCLAAGRDNRTAFVLTGGPDPRWFWNDPTTEWVLVDLVAGTRLQEGDLGVGNATHAAMSPDGGHAAVGDFDGMVSIIDLTTGEPVRPPVRAHRDGVFWVAFSPDGSRLVSGAIDGTVALWDVASGEEVATTSLPRPAAVAAEFRPGGQDVVVAPWWGDPAVYVWDPSVDAALRVGCRAAGRNLSPTEWREEFGDLAHREICPGRS